jgi:hypothetical protein
VRFTILFQYTLGSAFGQWRVIYRGWGRKLVKVKKASVVVLGAFVDGF